MNTRILRQREVSSVCGGGGAVMRVDSESE